MSLILDGARDMNIFQLNDVLYESLGEVRTNMSRTQFMGFTLNAMKYSKYKVNSSYRVPQDGLWEYATKYGMSVVVLTDPVASVKDLHQYLYG